VSGMDCSICWRGSRDNDYGADNEAWLAERRTEEATGIRTWAGRAAMCELDGSDNPPPGAPEFATSSSPPHMIVMWLRRQTVRRPKCPAIVGGALRLPSASPIDITAETAHYRIKGKLGNVRCAPVFGNCATAQTWRGVGI
jgi:hypothetical protein